jgi:hypothetical protein
MLAISSCKQLLRQPTAGFLQYLNAYVFRSKSIKWPLSVLTTLILAGQSNALAQAKKEMTTLKAAKGYALCYCINKHYSKRDTACPQKSTDYSGAYFVQQTDLSVDMMDKITAFIDEQYGHFYPGPPAENRKGNMVCFTCWQLYESKKPQNFLRKLTAQP